ncbi:hypothetical protein NMY22_g18394 [Coprinellus aureogranulatus]|nr:hypothetical protein NMY22_g18394 [Coprinellus aureogranulatus]
MGRPAKYFTREERLAARRIRLAERYNDPKFVESRSKENRRYYAKKRLVQNANIAVPERVQEVASLPYSFKDTDVVIRFRAGYNIELLAVYAVCDTHLDVYSRLPPYPESHIVDIDLDKDWDALSAALYGYQVRKYIESLQEQIRLYNSETKVTISTGLVRQFNRLEELWGVLDKAVQRYLKAGKLVPARIANHTARWQATTMMYIKQDLEALAKPDDSYISLVQSRISQLSRQFEEEEEEE